MTFNVYDLEKVLRQEAERLKNDADNRADVKNDRPYLYEYIKEYTHYCQALIDLCADGGDKIYLENERDRQLVSMTMHIENAERRYDVKSARANLIKLTKAWNGLDELLTVIHNDDLLWLNSKSDFAWSSLVDNYEIFDDALCKMLKKYGLYVPVPEPEKVLPDEPVQEKKRRGRPKKKKE